MKAVLKHELSSYFTGLTGYIFGAFLLLFAGIYTMIYNLQQYMLVNFEYVLGEMSFIYLIIVPILTMRILAEERRQKTDQLLYSLPLTMTQVVLGKYFAMLVMLLIPCAIMCVYPVALLPYGKINLMACYSSVFGFFCLGAALLAIGMYISSLTESQPVAAGLCFVIMLVNYYIAYLASCVPSTAIASLTAFVVIGLVIGLIIYLMTKNFVVSVVSALILVGGTMGVYAYDSSLFDNLFPQLMENLSLFERFYVIVNGVFDLTSIVYLVSVAALFVFLSVQSMEKRRWSE